MLNEHHTVPAAPLKRLLATIFKFKWELHQMCAHRCHVCIHHITAQTGHQLAEQCIMTLKNEVRCNFESILNVVTCGCLNILRVTFGPN